MCNLLIVTDIFGCPKQSDISPRQGPDRQKYRHLTLSELSGRPGLNGEDLHKHLFQEAGLEAVLEKLAETGGFGWIGLGYSAGGTALWRAVSGGLDLSALICVSSTRLRYETSSLSIPTYTFWGEHDKDRPSEDWNRAVPTSARTYSGAGHDFYRRLDTPQARSLNSDIRAIIDHSCATDGTVINRTGSRRR